MRSLVVALLGLAGVALTEGPALGQKGMKGGMAARYGWGFSLSAGRQLAQKTGKPLMVVLRCDP